MVAKINKGQSLYGALAYNHRKVTDEKARMISGNRIIMEENKDTEKGMRHLLLSFENYLLANKKTEKPILHISLNPSLEDNLTDEQFAELAKEYMEKMNYGNQPYVVFLHEDIERRHIHIVTTCVDEQGRKISDTYEWRRSMQACRELEMKYHLQQVPDQQNAETHHSLKKADYRNGNLKNQISNILKAVKNTYRYQTFGEYSALLSCFNIEVKQVKGEHAGVPFIGIVYSVTDDAGNTMGTPVKSSIIGKSYGYEGLNKRMKQNTMEYKAGKWNPMIEMAIAVAMRNCQGNRKDFAERLKKMDIEPVFRENKDGRLYGATFIDHANKEVYNGSRLGKEFSANYFHRLFNETPASLLSIKQAENENIRKDFLPEDFSSVSASNENTIEQFSGLTGIEPHGNDPEEEEFLRRIRYRKKKKNRSRGI